MGLSHVMDIAAYSINICSLIGLGVAIDYSLFTVSRYREELAAGHDYREALEHALEGGGASCASRGSPWAPGSEGFSSSAARSFGPWGSAVPSWWASPSSSPSPSCLPCSRCSVPRSTLSACRSRASARVRASQHRTASWVMRRPVAILVPALAFLLWMGTPFLKLQVIANDVRVLGSKVEAREGFEILKRDFPDEGQNRATSSAWCSRRHAALNRTLHQCPLRSRAVHGGDAARDQGDEPRERRRTRQGRLRDRAARSPSLYQEQVEAGKKMTVGDRVVLLYALVDSPPETEAAKNVVPRPADPSRRRRRRSALLVGN